MRMKVILKNQHTLAFTNEHTPDFSQHALGLIIGMFIQKLASVYE